MGSEDVGTEEPGQVGYNRVRMGPNNSSDLGDGPVGCSDQQQVNAGRRVDQAITPTEVSEQRPASLLQGPAHSSAGAARSDDP
jgi:hypothetical protein